jgi:Ca2+-binding EF-hand superfamily protein
VADRLVELRTETHAMGNRYRSDVNWSEITKAYSAPVTPKQYQKVEAFWNECDRLCGGREEAFHKFDINGNGDLTCIEFMHSAVQHRIFRGNTQELKEVFRILDANRNGCVDLEEFLGEYLDKPDPSDFEGHGKKGTRAQVIIPEKEEPLVAGNPSDQSTLLEFLQKKFPDENITLSIKRGFEAIDNNRNGKVSQTEFYDGLSRMGYPGKRLAWKKLFYSLDVNQNGSLSLGEFSNWLIIESRQLSAGSDEAYLSPAKRERMKDPNHPDHALLAASGGKRVARRMSWSRRASDHTTTNTEAYDHRGHFQDVGEAVILQGATSGFQRAANHGALIMIRPEHIDKVRTALAAMAKGRKSGDTKLVGDNLRSRGFDLEAFNPLKPMPEPARFLVHVPREPIELPLCNSVQKVVDNDEVFRRTTYD